MKKKTFLVLDGNALLHRAWHAIPPLTAPDGRVVNAAYGITNIVEKMRADFKPDYMAVAWDLPGETFRHKEYKEYKATREKKEQELYDQIEIIQEILDAYAIPSLSAKGMEADDVLGTLAKKYGPKKDVKVLILTGDLDALQLVDKDVEVVVFIKGLSETKLYDTQAVKERYGLTPDQLIDFKALMGDPSDNIPGIAGIGKKTAADLLQQYSTLEGIFEALGKGQLPEKFAKKFQGQEKLVAQMKKLVTIVEDVPLPGFKMSQTQVEAPNKDALITLFEQLGFKRLLAKYESGDEAGEVRKISKIKKTKEANQVKKISDLETKQVAVALVDGQKDLFGGSVQEIALFDGKKIFFVDRPNEKVINNVAQFLNSVDLIVGHDLKAVMHHLGVLEGKLFDTMVAAYLLNPGIRSFDLPTIVREYLQKHLTEQSRSTEQAKNIFELHRVLSSGLEETKMTQIADEIDMPLVPILYKMEHDGIEVDEKKLNKLSIEFGEELEKLTKQIYKLAGHEFNINSPSQLAEILFNELNLPTKGIKKTKKGISTAAAELEKLWEEHKIIPLVSEYREFAKLKSTYVDALPELIAKDERIHTSFNQTVTATGRLSSSDPNLQNIPTRTELGKEIRKSFVAPRGRILVAMDYSQFELRLAAVIAKDESSIKAFQEGADIHRRTAAEVLGKKEEDVSKAERSAAKAINFGILYGMGVRNLARSTGFSQTEAKDFIDRYFAVHPGISAYIETAKALAHERGYAETLFGRRRYLPEINSGIQQLVAGAERMAVNMPVQGTQADLVKMAMVDVADWINLNNSDIKMLLQVHDELVFEMKEEDVNDAVPELRQIMEGIWKSEVPLLVDVEVGKNWGELKEWR